MIVEMVTAVEGLEAELDRLASDNDLSDSISDSMKDLKAFCTSRYFSISSISFVFFFNFIAMSKSKN